MIPHLEEAPTLALLDGRYELHERVGEGGMAHVYRADDIVRGRTVAMRSDADVLAARDAQPPLARHPPRRRHRTRPAALSRDGVRRGSDAR